MKHFFNLDPYIKTPRLYTPFFLSKVKVLKKVGELNVENLVLGQYVGNKTGTTSQLLGYLDEPSVIDKGIVMQ